MRILLKDLVRHLPVVLLALFFCLNIPSLLWGQFPSRLVGRWCTVRVLPTSNVQGLSEEEKETFLSQVFSYSPDKFQTPFKLYAKVRYETESLSTNDLSTRYKIIPKEIGLGGRVAEISIRDNEGHIVLTPGSRVLMGSTRSLIWPWNGAFFEARPCSDKQPEST